MRHSLVVAFAVALLGAATASAFTVQPRDAPWRLLGVSTDGRSLRLGYEGGGCLRADGRPSVAEEKRRVVVTVDQTGLMPGEGEACTTELRFYYVNATLSRPLAGRRVAGGPPSRLQFPTGAVPRVVGMDRRDALSALRGQGFRSRTVGRTRRGMVVRQHPRAGTPIPPGERPPLIRLRTKQ